MSSEQWTRLRRRPSPARDSRQPLYDAQEHAGYRDWGKFKNLEAAQEFVDTILASRWWKFRAPEVKEVTVRMTRGLGGATAQTAGRLHLITLGGKWALDKGVVIHELAHFLAGMRHRHDAVFAYAYLQMVARWLGPQRARRLKKQFQNYGVPHSV